MTVNQANLVNAKTSTFEFFKVPASVAQAANASDFAIAA
jgi:hypothetical protein